MPNFDSAKITIQHNFSISELPFNIIFILPNRDVTKLFIHHTNSIAIKFRPKIFLLCIIIYILYKICLFYIPYLFVKKKTCLHFSHAFDTKISIKLGLVEKERIGKT